MKPVERTIAFFAAMLITFGITGIDLDEASFSSNQKEYILLGFGIIFMIAFFIMRRKK